jgi:hypothetical protein
MATRKIHTKLRMTFHSRRTIFIIHNRLCHENSRSFKQPFNRLRMALKYTLEEAVTAWRRTSQIVFYNAGRLNIQNDVIDVAVTARYAMLFHLVWLQSEFYFLCCQPVNAIWPRKKALNFRPTTLLRKIILICFHKPPHLMYLLSK